MSDSLPLKARVLLFLYGTKNLTGCVLALAGLGLFFAGVIDDWWLGIVVGLYGAGWLMAPENRQIEFTIRNETHRESLVETIDELSARARKRLPSEAVQMLKNIRETVGAIAPRLSDGTLNPEQKATILNSVTRDLPGTISNYLRLPAAYANVHAVEKGKTCKHLLLDQLEILDIQLKKIADGIYRNDADALILNGRILGEKFHSVSFVG